MFFVVSASKSWVCSRWVHCSLRWFIFRGAGLLLDPGRLLIARPAIDAGGDVDIVQIRVHFVVRGWLGRSVCSTFFGVAAVWVGGPWVNRGGVSLCLSGSTDLKLSSLAVFHQVCNNLNAGVAAFALIPILSRASSFFKRLELCELL